ncbi:MAG: hypothetical protein UT39_C0012G0018 [Candidatus Woesebacteria bacterium GW2011_GWA1_39_21]|uniref:Uncharacterized protein n=1 Tax=Candidatus Woesebacteria bacterium GW2011_GWA1_39_21 TaxID=1618550 RepID=A0A0G0NDU9_9BACT|nr:MAG: hypothetical protein UT39_C0012G0018 [Candidatus Woesebacteria bacterium GW2011_GWA1_39_21]
MSKVFFDHLIEIDSLKVHIENIVNDNEEKVDLWNLVDEYINNKIIGAILSELNEEVHEEFISMFLERPYDLVIIDYLNERLETPVQDLIGVRMVNIVQELNDIFGIESHESHLKQSLMKKQKK